MIWSAEIVTTLIKSQRIWAFTRLLRDAYKFTFSQDRLILMKQWIKIVSCNVLNFLNGLFLGWFLLELPFLHIIKLLNNLRFCELEIMLLLMLLLLLEDHLMFLTIHRCQEVFFWIITYCTLTVSYWYEVIGFRTLRSPYNLIVIIVLLIVSIKCVVLAIIELFFCTLSCCGAPHLDAFTTWSIRHCIKNMMQILLPLVKIIMMALATLVSDNGWFFYFMLCDVLEALFKLINLACRRRAIWWLRNSSIWVFVIDILWFASPLSSWVAYCSAFTLLSLKLNKRSWRSTRLRV